MHSLKDIGYTRRISTRIGVMFEHITAYHSCGSFTMSSDFAPRPYTPSPQSAKQRRSSSGRASDRNDADAGSIPLCGTGFFLPESTFSAHSLAVPPCAIACINICAHVKDSVTPCHNCTKGWVARLYHNWLCPGKANRIFYGRNPTKGQCSCKKKKKKKKETRITSMADSVGDPPQKKSPPHCRVSLLLPTNTGVNSTIQLKRL